MMTKTMQKYDENELAAKMLTTQWRQWTQLCFLPHTGADIVDYIVENIFDNIFDSHNVAATMWSITRILY